MKSSSSRTASSFEQRIARARAGSMAGRLPGSSRPFMRLKAGSTCHRNRYGSSACVAVKSGLLAVVSRMT